MYLHKLTKTIDKRPDIEPKEHKDSKITSRQFDKASKEGFLDAVGTLLKHAYKLENSDVVPGTYENATVTVDINGRVTAAEENVAYTLVKNTAPGTIILDEKQTKIFDHSFTPTNHRGLFEYTINLSMNGAAVINDIVIFEIYINSTYTETRYMNIPIDFYGQTMSITLPISTATLNTPFNITILAGGGTGSGLELVVDTNFGLYFQQ